MPIGLKLIISLTLIALISRVALINPDSSRSNLARRTRDPVRNLILRQDGTMRRHVQPAGLLLLYLLLALVWFGVPGFGCISGEPNSPQHHAA